MSVRCKCKNCMQNSGFRYFFMVQTSNQNVIYLKKLSYLNKDNLDFFSWIISVTALTKNLSFTFLLFNPVLDHLHCKCVSGTLLHYEELNNELTCHSLRLSTHFMHLTSLCCFNCLWPRAPPRTKCLKMRDDRLLKQVLWSWLDNKAQSFSLILQRRGGRAILGRFS